MPGCGNWCHAGGADDRPWTRLDSYAARAGCLPPMCQAACLWLLRPAPPGQCSRSNSAAASLAQGACFQ